MITKNFFRKNIVCTLAVVMAAALMGCSSEVADIEYEAPSDTEISDIVGQIDDAIKDSIGIDAEDSKADNDIAAMLEDAEYINYLEKYARQFEQYGGLCLIYQGDYATGGFDDQTKCEMIGFAESTGDAIDSKGLDYSEDYENRSIKSDRVKELSEILFGSDFDYTKAEKFESIGREGMSEPGKHATCDEDGNIHVNEGDWGLAVPRIENIDYKSAGGDIAVSCNLWMYDLEGEPPMKAYDIGTYTLILAYDDDPYKVHITDYQLDVAEVTLATQDEAVEKLIQYYSEKYPADGEYVIFDTEINDSEYFWDMTVRYQPSDAEEEEMIANGSGPLANIYFRTVWVQKRSLICSDDSDERFKLGE